MGEKYAKEDILTTFGGMWMATLVLLPLGLFLMYKALQDSQLFNKESYYRLFKRFKRSEGGGGRNKKQETRDK